MNTNISEKLIQLVNNYDRRQGELAEKLGVTQGWLSQVKNGKQQVEEKSKLENAINLLYYVEFESLKGHLAAPDLRRAEAAAAYCGLTIEELAAECVSRFGDIVSIAVKSVVDVSTASNRIAERSGKEFDSRRTQ